MKKINDIIIEFLADKDWTEYKLIETNTFYIRNCYGGTVERTLRTMRKSGKVESRPNSGRGSQWRLSKTSTKKVKKKQEEDESLFTDTFFGGKKPELNYDFLKTI